MMFPTIPFPKMRFSLSGRFVYEVSRVGEPDGAAR